MLFKIYIQIKIKFWKNINFYKPKQSSIKTLVYNNEVYHSNIEKSSLFENILATTFSKNDKKDNYDKTFEKEAKEKYKNINNSSEQQVIRLISKSELEKTIKWLNNKHSAGIDGISNVVIKKLPPLFINLILSLFNKTIIEAKIPTE